MCHKFSWQVFMVYFEYFFKFLSKIQQTHLWYQKNDGNYSRHSDIKDSLWLSWYGGWLLFDIQ